MRNWLAGSALHTLP